MISETLSSTSTFPSVISHYEELSNQHGAPREAGSCNAPHSRQAPGASAPGACPPPKAAALRECRVRGGHRPPL